MTVLDWISVKIRVPDNERAVVCWCKDRCIGIGCYSKRLSSEYKGEGRFVIGNYVNEDVIAWAEINSYEGE